MFIVRYSGASYIFLIVASGLWSCQAGPAMVLLKPGNHCMHSKAGEAGPKIKFKTHAALVLTFDPECTQYFLGLQMGHGRPSSYNFDHCFDGKIHKTSQKRFSDIHQKQMYNANTSSTCVLMASIFAQTECTSA